jgi:hypothetical protein
MDTDTIAGRLALAGEQLELLSERLNDLTADDMRAVAAYLEPLAEHGYRLCVKALDAIERTHSGHATRDGDGLDLQSALGCANDLFSVLIHHAYDAQRAVDAMTAQES